MAFRGIEGVETASNGEGQDRFLAVYPAGKTSLPVAPPIKPRGFGDRGRNSGDRGRPRR
jgi:spoIIIJ-associated protein